MLMNQQEGIARGWSIIPTGMNKKPLLATWKEFQVHPPSATQMREFERKQPSAWAAITGEVSGFLTLDFDGAIGCETLSKLDLEPHRKTPSGGFHVDFVHPGWKVQTLNSKSKRELGAKWPGLDIRADGGYVIFTGRTVSGEYEWLRDPEPYSLDILPIDLRQYLGLVQPEPHTPFQADSQVKAQHSGSYRSSDGRVSADRLVSDALGRVHSEGRNNAGFWLACQLRDNGYGESAAESEMRHYASRCPSTNTKGQPEAYTEGEAVATIRAAFSQRPREPWTPRRNGSSTSITKLEMDGPSIEIPQIDESKPFTDEPEPEPQTNEIDWRDLLIKSAETKKGPGGPKPILANAITALRFAPDWQGVLGYDEFALRVVAQRGRPWAGGATNPRWSDNDDRLTANWLQHEGIFVSVETAGHAVQTVAMEGKFHPVREYLDALEWDGVRRLEVWLSRYAGAGQTRYVAAVGSRWMIAAAARVYKPGIKADCMLILEAKQGALKSTLFKTLAGDWFTDEIADLGSKDAAMQTSGVWIIEVGELDSMSRAESGKIKAFMSRTTDRFRPPYGKQVMEAPRQCIFAGTVNHANYLKDETGARRFWPVACGKIDIPGLTADRNQLWAEAVHQFRNGANWWLDTEELNREAEAQQAERYDGDAWDELIQEWVDKPEQRNDSSGHPILPFTSTRDAVTVTDVLIHAIGKRQDQWTQQDTNRVARALKSMDWVRLKQRFVGGFRWEYKRPS
jgi:predicted P-loop ATPase